MIRQRTVYLNLAACSLGGMAILAPFFPYAAASILSVFVPDLFGGLFLDPFLALAISAVIAVVIAVIFYRMAIKNARELLMKAEI
jgi:O-antigen ligase